MIYFVSDVHLGHINILKYDKERWRLFDNVEEHDTFIIQRINEIVWEDDVLYMLWDLALTSKTKAAELLSQLKCNNMHWVLWNHDGKVGDKDKHVIGKLFLSVEHKIELEIEGRKILLIHYPPVDKNGNRKYHPEKYDIVVHGHTHKSNGRADWNTIDISYNGGKLIRDLQEIIWKTCGHS